MSDDYNSTVDGIEELLGKAAANAEPKAKALIERLNDDDIAFLRTTADGVYHKRQGTLSGPDREYRERVSTMSNVDFEIEKSKLK